MRAFITGIGGFVGPHLAEHLVRSGDDVCGASLSGRRDERPAASGESRRLESTDVLAWDVALPPHAEVLARLRQFAPQVIYHLAAISIPADCGQGEPNERARAVNVAGVRHVLDLAASLPGRPRIVFVSTSHVYAQVAPDAPLIDEHAWLAPINAYGLTKLDGERIVLNAVRESGLDAIILRAFKHAGPGQSARFMLPEWARQLADRQLARIEVHTFDSYLDLTDVRDVVRAYRLAASRAEAGAILNVGSGESRRSGDLFQALRGLANDHREVVETRPGRRQEAIANCTQLRACTGWTPQIPLAQTIADVWQEWRAAAT